MYKRSTLIEGNPSWAEPRAHHHVHDIPAVSGICGIINVFLLLAYLATRRRVSIRQ
jgi:hypothetical protein